MPAFLGGFKLQNHVLNRFPGKPVHCIRYTQLRCYVRRISATYSPMAASIHIVVSQAIAQQIALFHSSNKFKLRQAYFGVRS